VPRSRSRSRGVDRRSDRALLALVGGGDAGALEALYDRYGGLAYSLACRILSDPSAAGAVVEEVFLAAWRDAGRLGAGAGTVAAALLADTRRRAVRVLRARAPDPALALASAGAPALEPAPPGDREGDGRAARVRRALSELPEAERRVVALAWLGYTEHEVARLVGLRQGTVSSRIAAGMGRLRTALATPEAELHP